jgi:hypothetical protein
MSYDLQNENVMKMKKEVNLTGNVVPVSWFENLTFDNGKPQISAIMILADICYWFRPTEVRDEASGKLLGYEQKFKADKLQKQYKGYVELFGFGKDEVKNAFKFLENEGLIEREFRNIVVQGLHLSNVMFIDLNIDRVKEITYLNSNQKTTGGYSDKPHGGITTNQTYTKTSHKNTQRDNNGHQQSAKAKPVYYLQKVANDEIVDICNYYDKQYYSVNEKVLKLKPHQWINVRKVLSKYLDENQLTVEDMKSVIDRYFCVVDSNDYNILHFISGDIIKHQIVDLGLAHYSEVN